MTRLTALHRLGLVLQDLPTLQRNLRKRIAWNNKTLIARQLSKD